MLMSVMTLKVLPLFGSLFFHCSSLPQSCHDEEDEDGEEVKSFEVGYHFVCLSLSLPGGFRCILVCYCLSDLCPLSQK